MSKAGKFIISLDFELHWGVFDSIPLESYSNNLKNVNVVIDRLLLLSKKYDIKLTFATVGMLFAETKKELLSYSPKKRPTYSNQNLNPYHLIIDIGENEIEDNFHFGKSIIERINQDGNHEVGTHTYSHYNCSEEGQTKEQFYEDLKSAKNIAKNSKVNLQSIVFPKNQIKTEYLKICKEMGILSYRGNEKSVIYNLSLKNYNKYLIKLMRLVRIADSYFNITGHNTYSQKSLINAEVELINIPSSRFLRPHNKSLCLFESFKRKRIIRSMKHAAKKNEVFHLWWHPHNFGSNIEENFYNLEEILKEYKKLNNKYDFKSMTMTNLTLGILK